MSDNGGANVREAVIGRTLAQLGWPNVGTVNGNLHHLDNVVIRNLRLQDRDLYICGNVVYRTSGQGAGMVNSASCGRLLALANYSNGW